jgi:hypothetical protein
VLKTKWNTIYASIQYFCHPILDSNHLLLLAS